MFQRIINLNYNNIIIGSDISALSYAYNNDYYVIYKNINKPHIYNINDNWDYEINLWNKLSFLLSQTNKIIVTNNISNIRLENNNLLKVITKNSLIINIAFKNLIISDDDGIDGLPQTNKTTSENCWVIDYFDVHCGFEHNYDFYNTGDEFVKKIYFYYSNTFPKRSKKDIACVSIVNKKYLDYFDFSQNSARLKILKIMSQIGIKGRMNGFYKGKRVYRPLSIESNKRIVFPLGKNIYKNLPENISVLYDDYKKILINKTPNDKILKLEKLYGIDI